jgi:hypothetical protein
MQQSTAAAAVAAVAVAAATAIGTHPDMQLSATSARRNPAHVLYVSVVLQSVCYLQRKCH